MYKSELSKLYISIFVQNKIIIMNKYDFFSIIFKL